MKGPWSPWSLQDVHEVLAKHASKGVLPLIEYAHVHIRMHGLPFMPRHDILHAKHMDVVRHDSVGERGDTKDHKDQCGLSSLHASLHICMRHSVMNLGCEKYYCMDKSIVCIVCICIVIAHSPACFLARPDLAKSMKSMKHWKSLQNMKEQQTIR